MRTACSVSLLLAVPALFAAPDPESINLRNLAPAKGARFITKGSATNERTYTGKAPGQGTGTETIETTRETETEILEVKAGKFVKLRSKIITYLEKTTRMAGARSQTQRARNVLVGLAVVSECTRTGWKSTLEKGKATAKQQQALDALTFDDEGLFPDRKVKVGDTWKVEPKALAKHFGKEVKDATGKVTATFKKIETVGGERCAVVEVDLSLRYKDVGKGPDPTVIINYKGTLTIHRSLQSGLYRKEVYKGTTGGELIGKTKAGDDITLATVKGKMTGEDTTRAVKK